VVVSAARNGLTRSSILTLSPAPVTIATLTIAPPSLIGSNDAVGTITLTDSAPALGIEVELLSSAGAVNVPAFVQIASGQSQATFQIATSVVTVSTPVTVTVAHAAITKSALLTLQPPAGNSVSNLSATPAFIVGGFSSQGTVTLSMASTDNGGSDVVLSSSDGALIVPGHVTVKKNKTSATFAIATNVVTAPRSVTLTASYGGVLRRLAVIVGPENAVTLASFTINPPRVIGGNPSAGAVVLSGPAPLGGAAVAVSTKRRNMITVPATVLIPEGATTATFPISTEPIHGNSDRAAGIDATYNGITQTATITMAPPITAESSVRKPIAQCASLALEPCLTVAGLKIATDAITINEARYSFYTPELQLLAETAYSTGPAKTIEYEYIWFGGQPMAQIETTTNTIHYYFNDHLGAPLLTTDASGAIDWRVQREPYGEIYSVLVGANRHQSLGLPGQEEPDRGPEASYNIFRWYRPGWGRYTQVDPLELRGGINLFVYARTNPIFFKDPLGANSVDYVGLPNEDVQKKCGQGALGCATGDIKAKCSCKCVEGAWRPKPWIMVGKWSVYYSTDCYDPAKIMTEEAEHIAVFKEGLIDANNLALKFKEKKYPTKYACEFGCGQWMFLASEAIQQKYKTALIDFLHPWKKCNGNWQFLPN
jgi:RHS repeat-associated protein